jgi:site-specific DNA-cytosine methylase
MRYISICSGIEAASVAWHGFGWTPLAFSEIEAFPSAVLAARWPQVPNLGDMTKFAEWPEELLAECDLLVGGPPCQAFSVAGLRKSLDDDRGNITLAYVKLLNHIDTIRRSHGRPPVIAVYENVPGLLSTKDNAFGCLVGALCGCDEAPETETGKWPKAGFLCGEARRVGYRVIDAQYFGVAQRRRRIFLVAVPCELVERLGERACPSEILSLRESVRGNPPTRRKTWEGTAAAAQEGTGSGVYPCIDANIDAKWGSNQWVDGGFPVVGDEPVYLDRAAFNQGVNAQYEPQITQDGVAGSMVARGPAAVGISGDCAGTLDANYHKGCGSAAFGEREVVFGGNNTSGPIDVAAALLAHGGSSGRLDFASESFAVVPLVANPLTHRMHKGINTTVDEGQTPIVTSCVHEQGFPDPAYAVSAGAQGKGGVFGSGRDSQDTFVATCVTGDRTHALTTRTAAEEDGTGRGNPIIPVAVGFNWQNGGGYGKANDGLGITEEGTGPLQRCNTPAVAFTQNQREEVRDLGEVATACSAEPGMHQQTYLAIPFDTTQVTSPLNYSNPKDGDPCHPLAATAHVPAVAVDTYNQTVGDTSIPVRVGNAKDSLPAVMVPTVAFNAYQRTEGSATWPIGASDGRKVEVGVRAGMQVRRLTPTECCRLQGFPDDHCDITFRKKPAADGPKYRALGNSMAVPCMWWLGHRIDKATRLDTAIGKEGE